MPSHGPNATAIERLGTVVGGGPADAAAPLDAATQDFERKGRKLERAGDVGFVSSTLARFQSDLMDRFEASIEATVSRTFGVTVERAEAAFERGLAPAGLDALMTDARGAVARAEEAKDEERLTAAQGHLRQLQAIAADQVAVGDFAHLTLAAQGERIAALNAKARRSADEDRLLGRYERLHESTARAIAEGEGLALARDLGLFEEIAALDLNDPASFAARADQAAAASALFGMRVSPFRAPEIEAFGRMAGQLEADGALDLAAQLRAGLGREGYTQATGQLARRHPGLSMALGLAETHPGLARRILDGLRLGAGAADGTVGEAAPAFAAAFARVFGVAPKDIPAALRPHLEAALALRVANASPLLNLAGLSDVGIEGELRALAQTAPVTEGAGRPADATDDDSESNGSAQGVIEPDVGAGSDGGKLKGPIDLQLDVSPDPQELVRENTESADGDFTSEQAELAATLDRLGLRSELVRVLPQDARDAVAAVAADIERIPLMSEGSEGVEALRQWIGLSIDQLERVGIERQDDELVRTAKALKAATSAAMNARLDSFTGTETFDLADRSARILTADGIAHIVRPRTAPPNAERGLESLRASLGINDNLFPPDFRRPFEDILREFVGIRQAVENDPGVRALWESRIKTIGAGDFPGAEKLAEKLRIEMELALDDPGKTPWSLTDEELIVGEVILGQNLSAEDSLLTLATGVSIGSGVVGLALTSAAVAGAIMSAPVSGTVVAIAITADVLGVASGVYSLVESGSVREKALLLQKYRAELEGRGLSTINEADHTLPRNE